eukprot:3426754-Amphidinium_carterae.1
MASSSLERHSEEWALPAVSKPNSERRHALQPGVYLWVSKSLRILSDVHSMMRKLALKSRSQSRWNVRASSGI